VSDWGLNEDSKDEEKIAPVLHYTDNLRLLDHDHNECKESRSNLTDTQLCVTPDPLIVAAYACEGNSRGPLTQEDRQGNRFIVGIISYESNCAEAPAKDPGVYANVSVFIDWIYKHIVLSGIV